LEDVARVKRTPTPRGAEEKMAKAKRIKRRSAGQSRRQFGSADWSKMARKGRITKNNNNINYKKQEQNEGNVTSSANNNDNNTIIMNKTK